MRSGAAQPHYLAAACGAVLRDPIWEGKPSQTLPKEEKYIVMQNSQKQFLTTRLKSYIILH